MKTFTKGKYTLEHTIGEGIFGQPEDWFEVTWYDGKGIRYHLPSLPPIRLHLSDLIFDPLRPYTEKEYEEILDRTIKGLD